MVHVLIIMSWFGGYVDGYAVTTQEFGSAEACANAANEIRREWDGRRDSLKIFCFPKDGAR